MLTVILIFIKTKIKTKPHACECLKEMSGRTHTRLLDRGVDRAN